MKKNLLVTLSFIAFAISTQSYAQSENGFFLSFNAGYNFASGSSNLSENTIQNSETPLINTSEVVKSSFGKGIDFGIAGGYMFNRHVGIELGLNYLLGSKISSGNSTKINGSYIESSYSSRMLQFKPSIIIAAGMETINPYAKFGLVVGSGAIYSESTDYFQDPLLIQNVLTIQKETYDGGLALGFQAGIGISYGLNTSLSLFGEINIVSMSYAPTKSKLTEFNVNGVDQLPNLPLNITEAEYVDTLTDVETPDPNAPSKVLKTYAPFSSIGINIGLRYSL
jgi:opacity protein-like surface antigen